MTKSESIIYFFRLITKSYPKVYYIKFLPSRILIIILGWWMEQKTYFQIYFLLFNWLVLRTWGVLGRCFYKVLARKNKDGGRPENLDGQSIIINQRQAIRRLKATCTFHELFGWNEVLLFWFTNYLYSRKCEKNAKQNGLT